MKSSPIGFTCQGFFIGDFMYQFKEIKYSGFYNRYFRFDKKLIEDKNWALLPSASKTIYPVIGFHRNRKTGKSYPSQETIGIMAGCDDKTARAGQKGFVNFPGITSYSRVTRRGNRAIVHKFADPPYENGRVFHFHNIMIEGGNWSQLSPSAKAIYPVMRHFSYFEFDLNNQHFQEDYKLRYGEGCSYSNGPDWFDNPSETLQAFTERKYEFCTADKDVLLEYSGLKSIQSIYNGLRDLKDRGLINEIKTDYFRGHIVYLCPPHHYKREVLNGKTQKRKNAS
jgi:hypothetical protein